LNYIAIAVLVNTGVTLLVYLIANRLLGWPLHFKPLALCTVCVFFISMQLPRIITNEANLLGILAVLTLFATIAAYFVAYYEEVDSDAEATQAMGYEQGTGNCVSLQSFITPGLKAEPGQPAIMLGMSSLPTQTVTLKNAEEIRPSVPCRIHNQPTALALQDQTLTAGEGPVAEPSDQLELDKLVDQAFSLKEQGQINRAIGLFRKALALYPCSDAAPYIAIELGGLLKQKGSYDEAIEVFVNARKMPQLPPDSTLAQEFIDTIAYLRIVRNVLLAHGLGFVPFNDIPTHLKQEIENEFQEWRKLG